MQTTGIGGNSQCVGGRLSTVSEVEAVGNRSLDSDAAGLGVLHRGTADGGTAGVVADGIAHRAVAWIVDLLGIGIL